MIHFKMNDGHEIPALGFGVYLMTSAEVEEFLPKAIEAGYRHIDTANAYFNEVAVGKVIRESGIPREDFFVTTKLFPQSYPYEQCKADIDATLERLGLDYVDLLLFHQPYGDYVDGWRAMEEAVRAGKVRSIGLSNFPAHKIEQIMNAKPEDRRSIFEEATGIIVFKSRKQDIERRLANSYTNLNIFLQRMGEVEHMLTPLARQAEKTKKYKELCEQLNHNEINLDIYKHDNAESARASIGSVLSRIQAEIDESRKEAEGMDEKYAENRRRIAQSDELLQKLNEKILEYTVEMQKKEGDVNVIRARITFFEQQKEGEEKAVEEGGARLEAIGGELTAAQNSADDYEKKILDAQRESETLSGEIAALKVRGALRRVAKEHRRHHRKPLGDPPEHRHPLRQKGGGGGAHRRNRRRRRIAQGRNRGG